MSEKTLVSGFPPMLAIPMLKSLASKGHEVTVAFSEDYSCYDRYISCKKVYHDFAYGLQDCVDLCKDMDNVLHSEGYRGNVGLDVFKSAEFFVKNTSMHINMLESARQNNIGKYVFASSCGSLMSGFNTVSSPSQVYGSWHKMIGEGQCQYYRDAFNMKISVVRFGSVYGPFDVFDENVCSVVASAIRQFCDKTDVVTFWGDGSAIRDFVFSDDCVKGIVSSLGSDISTPIEIGVGKGVSIKDLVELVSRITNNDALVRWDVMRPVGEKSIVMDKCTQRDIGFLPQVTLEDGLSKTIEWYRTNRRN